MSLVFKYNPCYTLENNIYSENMIYNNEKVTNFKSYNDDKLDTILLVDSTIYTEYDFNLDLVTNEALCNKSIENIYSYLRNSNIKHTISYLNHKSNKITMHDLVKIMMLKEFHEYVKLEEIEFNTTFYNSKIINNKTKTKNINIKVLNNKYRVANILIVYGNFYGLKDNITVHSNNNKVAFTLKNNKPNIILFSNINDSYSINIDNRSSCVVLESGIEFMKHYEYAVSMHKNNLYVPSQKLVDIKSDILSNIIDKEIINFSTNKEITNDNSTKHIKDCICKLNNYSIITNGIVYGKDSMYDINTMISMINGITCKYVMIVLDKYYDNTLTFDSLELKDKNLVFNFNKIYGNICTYNITKVIYDDEHEYIENSFSGFINLGKTFFAEYIPVISKNMNVNFTDHNYKSKCYRMYGEEVNKNMRKYTCLLISVY